MRGDVGGLAVAVVVAYLLGSVPVAVLVMRSRGVDPRDVGDRNPGYWNVKEQFGARAALPVMVGDTAKGLVAGVVGVALAGDWWGVGYAAVASAMVGHAFPLFAGFRGGRSVLTFAGGVIALATVPALVALVVCAVVSVGSRSFAVGARMAVFGFPVVQLAFESKERVAATGGLMCVIGLRFAMAAVADRRRSQA